MHRCGMLDLAPENQVAEWCNVNISFNGLPFELEVPYISKCSDT